MYTPPRAFPLGAPLISAITLMISLAACEPTAPASSVTPPKLELDMALEPEPEPEPDMSPEPEPELDMSPEPELDMEPPPDPLEVALLTGDPTHLMGDELSLLEAIIEEVERLEAQIRSLLSALFLEGPISYNPGQNSQYFTPLTLSETFPLITGAGGRHLAAAYERGASRGAAFGTHIWSRLQRGELSEVAAPVERLLMWLLRVGDEALPQPRELRVVGFGGGARAEAISYLTSLSEREGQAWRVSACDALTSPELEGCLEGADLVIFGTVDVPEVSPFVEALRGAQSSGAALLYTHHHSWNSAEVTRPALSLLGLSIEGPGGPGNFFAQDQASWSSAEEMLSEGSRLLSFKRLAERALMGDFGFEVSACVDGCGGVEGYERNFGQAARALRQASGALDRAGRALFDQEGERLHKLLTLLGDVWRARVTFPLDRATSPTLDFLKAYYADHATLLTRAINPAQPDLGNFSRVDLSSVTPQEVSVQITSRPPFRSARVYALPGQPFRVERLDEGDVKVWVQVNSLRSASTKEFEEGGYTRPKFLTSEPVPLTRGVPLTLTSPYGGPVMLRYSEVGQEVSVRFTGVGQHPVWTSPEDDQAFQEALDAHVYDWAEVITPHFEVHSTHEKMLTTLSSPLASTGSALTALITEYHHGLSLALAGYQGPAIPTLPEVTDFITARGWRYPTRDQVQHFNADQPTCGYGCSGNPYDAGWAFAPLAHGDLHEVGHNHERGVFKFDGREGHATTNPYSYYPKMRHGLSSGLTPDCQSLPFRALFEKLQDAQLSADPFEAMHSDASLNGWAQGVATLIQALMVAERQGVITYGWELMGRLHSHERTWREARDDNALWAELSTSLGFSGYTRAEGRTLSNNDYLLIALGAVTELDYRDYFEMWGLEVTPQASAQVALEGYPSAPRVFYAAEPTDACSPWAGLRELPVDGEALWVDLSALERQEVTLSAEPWRSAPLSSEGSSVYFIAMDSDVGPTGRVWWGQDGALTELNVLVEPEGGGEARTLIVDAYQQRCEGLMTLNAGRVGGCEHRLVLLVDPAKQPSLTEGVRYQSPAQLPLLLEAWRWHTPEERLYTFALDIRYTR